MNLFKRFKKATKSNTTSQEESYKLNISKDLYQELSTIAKEHNTTVTSVISTYMKLGMTVTAINKRDDARIMIIVDWESPRELTVDFK